MFLNEINANFEVYKKRDVSGILRLKYQIFAAFRSYPICLRRYTSFTGDADGWYDEFYLVNNHFPVITAENVKPNKPDKLPWKKTKKSK